MSWGLHFLCHSAPHEAQPKDATDVFHLFAVNKDLVPQGGLSIYEDLKLLLEV